MLWPCFLPAIWSPQLRARFGLPTDTYLFLTLFDLNSYSARKNPRAVIDAFRREYPRAKPFDLWSVISVAPSRQGAILQAERKSALGTAPAYQYLFAWHTPMLDGRPRAFHSCEIAFVFDNADLHDCDFQSSSFAGSSFKHTDLSNADLDWATMTGAQYDCGTKFPQAFDPKAAGMINVDGCPASEP